MVDCKILLNFTKKMNKMRNIIYLIAIILVSCSKENIQPNTPITNDETIVIYGKWLLVGGSIYIHNLETNEKIKYSHFGLGKNTSGLLCNNKLESYWDLPIQKLELNITTWSFYQPPMVPGFGRFALNDDTLNTYGFNVTKNNWTIMENPQSIPSNMQMNGSVIPINASICNYLDSTVYFYTTQNYIAIKDVTHPFYNQNCAYKSELKFKKIKSW